MCGVMNKLHVHLQVEGFHACHRLSAQLVYMHAIGFSAFSSQIVQFSVLSASRHMSASLYQKQTSKQINSNE